MSCGEKNVGGFRIDYNGETLGLFHNNSTNEITVDLSKCTGLDGYSFTELADYIGVGSAKLNATMLTVGPQTSVILK